MSADSPFFALAFYCFTPLESPEKEIKKHKNFFLNKPATGRIYISEEGINSQMSGTFEVVDEYQRWILEDPRFQKARFNRQPCTGHIFPRMNVKYRKELAALGEKVTIEETGTHLPPKEWREMLESDEDKLLIDVRNDYEWKIGHFEGAELPPLKNFRDFPEYADQLKETQPKEKKIMMYCTGGIRCELYSALLKKRGFENVYQLEGGILNYGEKEGPHYKGKVFVFDDRLAVPINEEAPIGKCHVCNEASDTYYNCTNMDCNELFLSCEKCHESMQGGCSTKCKDSPRRRPFDKANGNRPFRRKHLVFKENEAAE